MIYLKKLYPGAITVNFDLPAMARINSLVTTNYNLIALKDSTQTIRQVTDLNKLFQLSKNQKYCVIAYWSYTEMPLKFRDKFKKLFSNAQFVAITANSNFEGVDNNIYLKKLSQEINFELKSIPIPLDNLMPYQKKHRLHILSKK